MRFFFLLICIKFSMSRKWYSDGFYIDCINALNCVKHEMNGNE